MASLRLGVGYSESKTKSFGRELSTIRKSTYEFLSQILLSMGIVLRAVEVDAPNRGRFRPAVYTVFLLTLSSPQIIIKT